MVDEFQTNGVKKNIFIKVRVDNKQKERLEALASASGYKTISDYVRTELLNPSIQHKLNKILELLDNGDKLKGEVKNGRE